MREPETAIECKGNPPKWPKLRFRKPCIFATWNFGWMNMESSRIGGGNSNISYFPPRKLGKMSNLTHIVQRGWNHQRVLLKEQHLQNASLFGSMLERTEAHDKKMTKLSGGWCWSTSEMLGFIILNSPRREETGFGRFFFPICHIFGGIHIFPLSGMDNDPMVTHGWRSLVW